MNVLLSLTSRIIGMAIYDLLQKDNEGDIVVIDDMGKAEKCFKPDIILIDNGRLDDKSIAAYPEAKLVLLDTGLPEDKIITLVVMFCLSGVFSTVDDFSQLKKALRLVNEGQIWISNNYVMALLHKAKSISKSGNINNVSKREKEIIKHMAEGKKNKEIAAQLYLSEQTIKAHISNIFKKFNVSSRTQLISLLMNSSQETSLDVLDSCR